MTEFILTGIRKPEISPPELSKEQTQEISVNRFQKDCKNGMLFLAGLIIFVVFNPASWAVIIFLTYFKIKVLTEKKMQILVDAIKRGISEGLSRPIAPKYIQEWFVSK